jgi:hypothetical protein
LARRVGNEPPLIGLIRVYKDYYPDVIVGGLANGRASVFMVSFNIFHFDMFTLYTNVYSTPTQNGSRDFRRFKRHTCKEHKMAYLKNGRPLE